MRLKDSSPKQNKKNQIQVKIENNLKTSNFKSFFFILHIQ